MARGEEWKQAALNNAHWCDAVCRVHGSPGEFRESLWISTGPVPQFYPNAITLGGAAQAAAHRDHIERLLGAGMPPGWAVKDSFGTLLLSRFGFRLLFDARWINMAVTPPPVEMRLLHTRWDVITTARELAVWESAWSGQARGPGVFLPALLADENVAFLAAYREERIVAGAVANRAAGVVGLSNIFLPRDNARLFRRACVAEAALRFPGLPLAGYEHGDDLAEMLAIGFETIGTLKVWARTAPFTP